uniref:RING finger protein nhl-1-like n=1 Tax=Ciona intestinalis TaxID=7719 RepID=UPI00052188E5|nr:RING finger protein nhl-1-like [Ciona intestinalis]|eukprot:XP_009860351.1 RING finger protein nhl-1-like [Ciona intestinalis]
MDKQLETLVTCAVCLDRFVHPKILPCQHTFCLKPCLQNLVIDKSIRCPHCRTIHKLPKRGLSDFPNNLTIVSILDFSPKPNSDIKICQECLKSNCATLLCQHCEKKLCETCLSVHSQQLIQGLMRSVNQVRRLFSKMSEMITELESRQIKSKTAGESVKTDIIKAIDRCIVQLTNRKKTLLGQVDLYVNAEGRQLKAEQENLEMELVNMSGHCENAEKKCQHFLDGTKRPTDPSFQNEITRLTHQSKEHLRNMKLIRSNVEERMLRCIEFHNDNEHTLHALMSSVGEVTFTSPTQLSFNLGSNAVYNEMEIERTFERSRTQSEEDADIVSNYIPSFTSPTTSPRLNVDSSVGSFISALITPRITNPTPALSINAQETQTFLRNKGRVKRCFSSKGSDISSLNWPRGVAVSPTNQIIVADSSNHRVQIFNEEGSPVLTLEVMDQVKLSLTAWPASMSPPRVGSLYRIATIIGSKYLTAWEDLSECSDRKAQVKVI